MAIWDAIKELERLQRKAAKGEEIEDKDTFIVRAALKEKGWEGLLCEEAISRGYKEARGEEVDFPSWYIIDDVVPTPPEVQGSEAPEEDEKVPGRVFNLLGDTPGEEPEEQEEVREERSEDDEAWDRILAIEKEKQDKMEKAYEDGLPSMADYDMAKKEQEAAERQMVIVGDEPGWVCKDCNRVWSIEYAECPSCNESPSYEALYPIAKAAADKAIADALTKKKSDKDLAIEAMHKALGLEKLEEDTGLEMNIVHTEDDGTVQCEHCGADDYLECDCCLECESEECVCCDECNRFPCHCDQEECPICHASIVIAEPCPNGCDSDIRELEQLYNDVKNSTELDFNEKVKFMSMLKEKMGLASHEEDPNLERDPVEAEEEPWEDLDDPIEEENNG